MPLVERINALPIAQFIEDYLPLASRQIQIPSLAKSSKPLSTAAQNCNRTAGEITLGLDLHSAESIPASDFQACFNLIELTSSRHYTDSSVGWSPSKKTKEMRLPDMRYILLRELRSDKATPNTTIHQQGILGFLSFMVTYENGKEVAYCYEIHLSVAVQGKGLGSQLIRLLEEIARKIGLGKVMLTVFKSNKTALQFYEKLGFALDEHSPQPRKLRNGAVKETDYLILSKKVDVNDFIIIK
jgi:N-alpha-acetyltransferase 40